MSKKEDIEWVKKRTNLDAKEGGFGGLGGSRNGPFGVPKRVLLRGWRGARKEAMKRVTNAREKGREGHKKGISPQYIISRQESIVKGPRHNDGVMTA